MEYCGLDISNKSTSICVIGETGKILKEQSVATGAKEIAKVLEKFGKVRCVIEASPLAESLAEGIERAGHKVEIIDVRQAKCITQSKKKTDRLDARKLAQMCRVGWYTVVHRKSGYARELRTYLTARMQIVKAATGLQAAIRGLLRAHGVVVPLGKKNFEQVVKKVLAESSELVRLAIEPLLENWEHLQSEEKRMYKELRKYVVSKDRRLMRLMTVPGVGPATAAGFLATIDDPRRFTSPDQVASYLGLVPAVYQSGEREVKGRITKHGDSLLRWLLVESAGVLLSHSNYDGALKSWGLKLQETKGFGKARVAVARKLACLLFHMLRSDEAYDEKLAA